MNRTLTLTFPPRKPEEDGETPILGNCIVALRTGDDPMPDMVYMDFVSFDTLAEFLREEARKNNAGLIIDGVSRQIGAPDFPGIVERLTELIHEDLDDDGIEDDPEIRADAFDEHPWAPLREAFWAAEPKIRGEDCLRIEALSGDGIGSIDAVTAWRISGVGKTAQFEDEEELAQDVARRMAAGDLSIRLVCLEYVIESEDIDALCDALTCAIADEIPSIEEEDARDDDFDNHPLCPIRDALVEVSPNFGGNAPGF